MLQPRQSCTYLESLEVVRRHVPMHENSSPLDLLKLQYQLQRRRQCVETSKLFSIHCHSACQSAASQHLPDACQMIGQWQHNKFVIGRCGSLQEQNCSNKRKRKRLDATCKCTPALQ